MCRRCRMRRTNTKPMVSGLIQTETPNKTAVSNCNETQIDSTRATSGWLHSSAFANGWILDILWHTHLPLGMFSPSKGQMWWQRPSQLRTEGSILRAHMRRFKACTTLLYSSLNLPRLSKERGDWGEEVGWGEGFACHFHGWSNDIGVIIFMLISPNPGARCC